MISFAAPQFAWALAVPAAILALYFLRRRYMPRAVPSTFLWRRAVRDHAANRPLQRLRRNLLLPVQLLAALLLVLGLMKPMISGGTAGRTVMIFDLSGSMQTVSAGKSRLDLAKERALETIAGLPAEEEITILTAEDGAGRTALTTTDREEARRAVMALTCGNGTADIDRALSLAEAIRREDEDTGARLIVYSDEYIPAAGVNAVNVGRGESNRAVYSVSAEEGSVYARAANFGEACTLTLVCRADGKTVEAKETEIPAGETAGVRFTIPEGTRIAEVEIREADALAADNRAEAPVIRSVKRTVALTADSLFLESALRVRPDVAVIRAEADALETTAADLYIIGESPVIFTLHPAETLFTWAEEKEAEGALSSAGENPLTAGLTMKNVALRTLRPLTGGKGALLAGEDVAAAYADGEAAVGFDLHDTNLPLKYDFPLLIQNILDYLLPPATEVVPETADPMPLRESDVRSVAPETEAAGTSGGRVRGRDLTEWCLAGFLVLLLAEFLLAREPWVRNEGRGRG
ncbi:MAG: BatA and WFA domain-containing protein [Clostridiales bacterium]|nr:BatA and WFA domain-containing protein [Clostridiales bacterium]